MVPTRVHVGTALVLLCLLGLIYHYRRKGGAVQDSEESVPADQAIITLEHCSCQRRIKSNWRQEEECLRVPYEQTTCGRDAYARGPGQNVVAYSFYGDVNSDQGKKKGYFKGVADNLKLMPYYYPGYVMRLYFDLSPEDSLMSDLCELACDNDLIDLCHAGRLPGTPMVNARNVFPMNWRFFPTLDPQVDVYHCRDLDSRPSLRELMAVEDWLATDQPVHSMRDHPNHNIPLLGASWGSDLRKKNARWLWRESWDAILKDNKTYAGRSTYGHDQQILSDYVWPWAWNMSVQHDSHHCLKFPGSRPWPTRRKAGANNFVAAVVADGWTVNKECPVECRPKGHSDWIYC